MRKHSVDICIVGAGPAGLTAALFLAKHGIPSLIVEKQTFPRDKICGDAFSGKVAWVLEKLELGLKGDVVQQSFQLPSWGVKFFGSKNNELKVPFKLDYNGAEDIAPGFIAKRLDFDSYLFEKAKASPLIEIIEGASFAHYTKMNSGIIATSKNNDLEVQCKLMLAADGTYSKAAKDLMGFKVEDQHNSLGIRTYYEGVEGLDAEGFIELHFLEELLPGYFWIFPLPNGQANVGAGIRTDLMRKKKINLKKVFHKVLQEHPIIQKRFRNAKIIDDIKTFGLPLGSVQRSISSNHLMLMGDAAALIDPFTGEGIGNAMISGMLAAEQAISCLKEDKFDEAFIKSYDDAVYRRMGGELKLSKQMQELSRYPWLFNLVVNKARNNKELRDTISCMFENVDIRKKLRDPLFYLRILFN